MKFKIILSIVILIVGIAMYLFSNYITDQVNAGKTQVASAQKKVSQANTLFSLSPYTKGIGKEVGDVGQKKISEGEEKIAKYEQMAHWLHTGGIILLVLGAGTIALSFVGKNKRKD